MNVPLHISYRNVQKNGDIEQVIYEKCRKLEHVCSSITSCRVVVEKPQVHQRTGSPYRVRLNLTIPPGHELVVKRGIGKGEMHDELSSIIRKLFNSAWRQLMKLKEQHRVNSK